MMLLLKQLKKILNQLNTHPQSFLLYILAQFSLSYPLDKSNYQLFQVETILLNYRYYRN